MNNISETLRRERLKQGLDLQKLSDITKISTRMLQAMEVGDLSKLPGGVFTRSFFKQYAIALGLDPAALEAEIRQLSPEPEQALDPRAGEPTFTPFVPSDLRSNSLTVASVWVVIALLGCGGVYYFARSSPASAPAKPPQQAAPSVAAAPVPAPVKVPESPAAPAPPNALPATPSIGAGSLQVVLNASEKSWVSIHVDGKLLFSGILQPNDRREIKAEEKVKVVAGNAGGIYISLNGKNIEALGPRGQVRTVEFTRAGAQVVSRTPKPGPLL
jgi:cytoskeleton protein RodZ